MAQNAANLLTVTQSPQFHAAAEQAVAGVQGAELSGPLTLEAAVELAVKGGGGAGRVVLVDSELPGNVYENLRSLALQGGMRIVLVTPEDNPGAVPIARFCGASGCLTAGFGAAELSELMKGWSEFQAPASVDEVASPILPEALLRELSDAGPRPGNLIEALADPETSLFNYDFLTYKLDEEFKRARRFEHALSCVMLGFDGECSEDVLRQLSSLFLQAARDTDILGRFDRTSFLFLLPGTPLEGARIMADRIRTSIAELGLRDLVGDDLVLATGIATWPHPEITRARDLYARVRDAYQSASAQGVPLVELT